MDIARLIAARDPTDIVTCAAGATRARGGRSCSPRNASARCRCCDGGKVAGIFSERDVIYRLADEGAAVPRSPVGEVMTAPPITVAPGDHRATRRWR